MRARSDLTFRSGREKIRSMPSRRSLLAAALIMGLVASACAGSDDPVVPDASSSAAPSTLAASVASVDLAAGSPQRFSLGIFSSAADGVKLLTFGQVTFRFAFAGGGSTASDAGPEVTGTYLSAFGMARGGSTPAFSAPSDARGVYEAEGVVFDQAGVWQVEVTAEIPGSGKQTLSATFPVAEHHALPAPGDRALHTENLTMDSTGVPAAAIDSRALDGAAVPNPELHATTIAAALDAHQPIVVVFATPTFCTSLMCGPEVVAVAALAKRYGDRAVFIHIEIWRNNAKQVINKAAADWLLRNGNLSEPWTYLIGSDGVIKDRWGPLFDQAEIAKELAELPRMRS
jgi:hypothetical protein